MQKREKKKWTQGGGGKRLRQTEKGTGTEISSGIYIYKKQTKQNTKHIQKKDLKKGNKTVSEQPDLCISIKNQSVLQPNLVLADKSMQIKGLIGLSCSVKVCGQTL